MKPQKVVILAFVALGMLVGFYGAQTLKRRLSPPLIDGFRLTVEQAAQLEAELERVPDDVRTRAKLLSFYFRQSHSDSEAGAARIRHLKWLVENKPQASILGSPPSGVSEVLQPVAYLQIASLWRRQIEALADQPDVLGNAAHFFLQSDRDLSLKLLQQAEVLEPKKPAWPERIGRLYALNAQRLEGEDAQETAALALAAFEQAYDRSLPLVRDQLLDDLAKAALASGRLATAKEFAEAMLEVRDRQRHSGPFTHDGNMILGRVALREGDIVAAKRHLLAAGEAETSPVLRSFGPSLLLAKELLELDERDTVVAYLQSCAQFWSMGRDDIEIWIGQIREGQTPDFGINGMRE